MALFDSSADDLGGAAVTPSDALEQSAQPPAELPPISLPDVTPIVSAMPHAAIPPPTPLPNPMNDPRQRLMALFTAGFAAGAGPRSGIGTGATYGLQHMQEQARQDALRQWQVNENERQRQIQTITQQNAELDRQRALNLQKSLESFAQGAAKAESKDDYDKLADAYGNGLAASGYRVSPNWLRANIPWQAPNRSDKVKKALAKWKANPNNQRLLDTQPQVAVNSVLNVDDGVPLTVGQALELNGEGFAKGPNGEPLIAPKPQAGTTPFDVKLNSLFEQWQMENPGKVMDPKTKNTIVDQAITASKEKPAESELDTALKESLLRERNANANKTANVETLGREPGGGLDYAASMLRITGRMPTLGMQTGDKPAIINRAAQQAKILGQTPAGAIQKQAAFKADASALTRMRTMSSAAESFEYKANAQADIIDTLSKKVDRTQIPIINQALQTGRTDLLGDSNAQQLANAIQTFSAEYAKIMEGSTGSVAASTEASRKAADRLISTKFNQKTMSDVLALMRREMALTVQGYAATIGDITERMGGQSSTTPPPATNDAASAARAKLQQRQ